MNDSFSSLIESSASILVVLPTKPTFDQTAAALSLYLSIMDKKEASIYCPSQITVGFNRLIGVNKVTTEIGNKNLTIKFVNYNGSDIEKVKADLEGNEFVLTVVPKTGKSSPKKDQMDLNYSGVSADLIILIGGANDSHFPILTSPESANAKIAHIGTRTLAVSREVMSFAKPGASSSELVANLIKENNLTLDSDSASNLVMGIEDGSSNFASAEVTPETFETFAHLLRSGGQRSPRIKLSPANFPPGSIPTKPFNQPQEQKPVQPEPTITQVETKDEMPVENPPEDWLQPKVFKGTSVS
jgi:hypothetical protein